MAVPEAVYGRPEANMAVLRLYMAVLRLYMDLPGGYMAVYGPPWTSMRLYGPIELYDGHMALLSSMMAIWLYLGYLACTRALSGLPGMYQGPTWHLLVVGPVMASTDVGGGEGTVGQVCTGCHRVHMYI